uniref:Ig-like domain-containing protein n=1 Tax=Astyanax mexicanus TaxID=7994 RepID=A0A8B9GZW9_ASTMX
MSNSMFSVSILLSSLCSVQMCDYCLIFTGRTRLSVKPSGPQIFRGEIITLRCDIPEESENYYIIRDTKVNHSLKYKCFGYGQGGQGNSDWSNEVTLTVIGYEPYLRVQPDLPQIFSGETVTLWCVIPGWSSTDWIYYWYSGEINLHSSDENYYIIRDIKLHQNLKYKCYGSGKRGQGGSQWSNEVTLTVIERPKASLILAPTEQIFSGETVTLTCDIKGHTDTDVVESDSGEFTCRGERMRDSQRSEISDAVTLTVSGESLGLLSVVPFTLISRIIVNHCIDFISR